MLSLDDPGELENLRFDDPEAVAQAVGRLYRAQCIFMPPSTLID